MRRVRGECGPEQRDARSAARPPRRSARAASCGSQFRPAGSACYKYRRFGRRTGQLTAEASRARAQAAWQAAAEAEAAAAADMAAVTDCSNAVNRERAGVEEQLRQSAAPEAICPGRLWPMQGGQDESHYRQKPCRTKVRHQNHQMATVCLGLLFSTALTSLAGSEHGITQPRPHDLRWVVRRAAGLKGQLSRSNTLSSGQAGDGSPGERARVRGVRLLRLTCHAAAGPAQPEMTPSRHFPCRGIARRNYG